MLLISLGAVELARWFFVKQALSLALLEAGRAGITDHARPQSIQAAFERALLPLFPATSKQNSQQRLQRALARHSQTAGSPAWQIKVVSPDTAAFYDFSSERVRVDGADGLAVIDNAYQNLQHQQYISQGWPEGRGPVSGITIFDANTLVLHLSYMHEPLVPGMRGLLGMLSYGSYGHARTALANGYLPMQQTMRLTMQSHPVAWPAGSANVFIGSNPVAAPPAAAGQCQGIWCNPTQASGPPPSLPPVTNQPPGLPVTPPASGLEPKPPPNAPDLPQPGLPSQQPAPYGDDATCGIVLCCVSN